MGADSRFRPIIKSDLISRFQKPPDFDSGVCDIPGNTPCGWGGSGQKAKSKKSDTASCTDHPSSPLKGTGYLETQEAGGERGRGTAESAWTSHGIQPLSPLPPRRRSVSTTASDHIRSPTISLRLLRHRLTRTSRGSVGPNTTGTPTTPIGDSETTQDTSSWPVATHHSALSPPGGTTTSTTTRDHIRSPHSDGDTSIHLPVDSRLDDQYHFSETSTGSQPQYSDAIRLADTTGPNAVGDGFDSRQGLTSDVDDRLEPTTASLPTRYRSPLVDADRLLSPTGYRPASQ